MKYYECPVSQSVGITRYTQKCGVPLSCKAAASLKPARSVHFPNDIVFQDYVRHGELERIGRFIRAGRVSLGTIYHSGRSWWKLAVKLVSTRSWPPRSPSLHRHGGHPWGGAVWKPGVCETAGALRSRHPSEGWGGMDPAAHGLQWRLPTHCTVSIHGFLGLSITAATQEEVRWSAGSCGSFVLFLVPRYLLSLGADPELENDCGEKPADLIDLDNRELLELFGLAANDWERPASGVFHSHLKSCCKCCRNRRAREAAFIVDSDVLSCLSSHGAAGLRRTEAWPEVTGPPPS